MAEPFRRVTSVAAPLMRINIDTDAIIPSREMKRVSRHGLAEGLFAGWRYREPGSREPDPDFVLNRAPYRDAEILLAGRNFGCGSSREHAVWALAEWGIRAVIAPSFGGIFRANCVRNGVLPVAMKEEDMARLTEEIGEEDPLPVTVDLERRRVSAGELEIPFEISDDDRRMLLEGLDPIAATLRSAEAIEAFEARDREARPWARL